tara:strand:+ start:73 stop:1035 length:963 start_codon:yes stop_codon:yes gene_type:complete
MALRYLDLSRAEARSHIKAIQPRFDKFCLALGLNPIPLKVVSIVGDRFAIKPSLNEAFREHAELENLPLELDDKFCRCDRNWSGRKVELSPNCTPCNRYRWKKNVKEVFERRYSKNRNRLRYVYQWSKGWSGGRDYYSTYTGLISDKDCWPLYREKRMDEFKECKLNLTTEAQAAVMEGWERNLIPLPLLPDFTTLSKQTNYRFASKVWPILAKNLPTLINNWLNYDTLLFTSSFVQPASEMIHFDRYAWYDENLREMVIFESDDSIGWHFRFIPYLPIPSEYDTAVMIAKELYRGGTPNRVELVSIKGSMVTLNFPLGE